MFGAIVGDVIGSPFEQINIRTTDFALFGRGSRCTDDSILTIATADALMNGLNYRAAYHDYFRRFPDAGYGSRFTSWAAGRGGGDSFGNGAAMRVSPVAWVFDDLGDVLDEAARSAMTSHAHPEGILGAQAVAGLVYLARVGRSKLQLRKFVTQGCTYELPPSLDAIRLTNGFDATCRATIPIAFAAFDESHDFESAVRLAVSVGGDSDTITSIAGAIAHAFYGRIPPALLGPVVDRFLPNGLASTCATFCERFAVRM